eukprot:5634465-Lingulodinium_polyedra.AAC.1
MDILSQRAQAIQRAKSKGLSWEKAEAIELTPPAGSSLAPAAMLSFTWGELGFATAQRSRK